MTISKFQLSFAGGEVSPEAEARIDSPIYQTSCERMINFTPKGLGPMKFRAGTRLGSEVDPDSILIPFIYNKEVNYQIEICPDGFAYMITENGREPLTLGTAVDLNLYSTAPYSGKTELEYSFDGTSGFGLPIGSIVIGYNSSNVELWRGAILDDVGVNTVVVDQDWTTFAGAGLDISTVFVRVIIRTPHPYDMSIISNFNKRALQWAQREESVYVVHPEYIPQQIFSINRYVISIEEFNPQTPPVGATDTNIFWFTALPIGVPIPQRSNWGGSSTGQTLPDDFDLYPSAVTFYEQRMFFGWNNAIYASEILQTGKPLLISWEPKTAGNITASNAFTYAPSYDFGFKATWLKAEENFLLFGTTAVPFVATGAVENEALTPFNVAFRPVDAIGCAAIPPIVTNGKIFYVESGRKRIVSLGYNYDKRGYLAFEETEIAEHALKAQVVRLVFTRGYPSILHCLLEDGRVYGFVVREGKLTGGHQIVTRSGDDIKDISLGYEGGQPEEDTLYLITERSVDGITKGLLETKDPLKDYVRRDDFYTGDKDADDLAFKEALYQEQIETVHLDAYRTFGDLGPTDEILIPELAGETVTVIKDGFLDQVTLDNDGLATLDAEYNVIHAGLPFIGYWKSLPTIVAGADIGFTMFWNVNIKRLAFKLFNSLGFKFGFSPYPEDLETVTFGYETGELTNRPVPLFTGYKLLNYDDPKDNEKGKCFYIIKDDPRPLTIDAIKVYFDAGEQ